MDFVFDTARGFSDLGLMPVMDITTVMTQSAQPPPELVRSVRTVLLPPWVRTLENCAFAGFESLEEIELPQQICEIPPGCFMGCCALKKVILPPSVRRFGRRAFWACISLETLEIPEGTGILPESLLRACRSLRALHLPASLHRIETRALLTGGSPEITLEPGNSCFRVVNGCLLSADGKTLYKPAADRFGVARIPDTVEHLAPCSRAGTETLDDSGALEVRFPDHFRLPMQDLEYMPRSVTALRIRLKQQTEEFQDLFCAYEERMPLIDDSVPLNSRFFKNLTAGCCLRLERGERLPDSRFEELSRTVQADPDRILRLHRCWPGLIRARLIPPDRSVSLLRRLTEIPDFRLVLPLEHLCRIYQRQGKLTRSQIRELDLLTGN